MDITETVPQFDARYERRASTYTDTPDPDNDRIIRVWDVEPVPLAEIRAGRRAAVELERDQRLATVDAATIRPLRALLAGSGAQADRDRLAGLEARAQAIRTYAAALVADLGVAATAEAVLAVDTTAGWP